MAAGVLQGPGKKYGVCAGQCQHQDCARTREMAATPCRVCTKPIGFGVRFYQENRTIGAPMILAHSDCADDEAENAVHGEALP